MLVCLISYVEWTNNFGGNSPYIFQTTYIAYISKTVVGELPGDFHTFFFFK